MSHYTAFIGALLTITMASCAGRQQSTSVTRSSDQRAVASDEDHSCTHFAGISAEKTMSQGKHHICVILKNDRLLIDVMKYKATPFKLEELDKDLVTLKDYRTGAVAWIVDDETKLLLEQGNETDWTDIFHAITDSSPIGLDPQETMAKALSDATGITYQAALAKAQELMAKGEHAGETWAGPDGGNGGDDDEGETSMRIISNGVFTGTMFGKKSRGQVVSVDIGRAVRAANEAAVWYVIGQNRYHVVSPAQLTGYGLDANMAQVQVIDPVQAQTSIGSLTVKGELPWADGCYRGSDGAKVYQFTGQRSCGVAAPSDLLRLCPRGVNLVPTERELNLAQQRNGDCP